ncbi:hypothetical protein [Altererythrobacter sp. MF3-039]|uniref:hypothetical protein n=1 Tax=Altererythrobacter sp. MF3-039 TaxID=3252901 RepID=UPI00390CBAFE
MNIDRKRIMVIAGGSLLLGGCAIDPETGDFVQYEMGESVKQTMMAQVIDPDPEYDTLVPETSGEQAADAIERYRNDAVKQPERQGITAGGGSGSGSGGGGRN